MKKIFLSIFVLANITIQAQELGLQDALRYAQTPISGTARYTALSGAMGAVGADLSAVQSNPAGSALFLYNNAVATLSNYSNKQKANYFGNSSNDDNNKFNINQIGAVFVFKNQQKSDWKKVSLFIGYENSGNFNTNTTIKGTNPSQSISNYFLNFAKTGNNLGIVPVELLELQSGETLSDLYSYLGSLPDSNYPLINGFAAQQALLGYQGYLFDYDNSNINNPTYLSNVPNGGNYYQQNFVTANGYNGKLTANLATQYQEKLFLGASIHTHFTDYTQQSTVTESNANSPTLGVQAIQFDNETYTYGNGFSFQLGAIAKVSDNLRLGVSYQSPTWYKLNDELSQRLIVINKDGNNTLNDVVNPNTTMVYEPYKLKTPAKLSGNAALFLGKKGFISFDYGTTDYTTTQYKPTNDVVLQRNNQNIADLFQKSIDYRIGLEYKLKNIILRGGYHFEESPYQNKNLMSDLKGYSGGIGFQMSDSRLDFSFLSSKRTQQQRLISSGMNDTAQLKLDNLSLSMTYVVFF